MSFDLDQLMIKVDPRKIRAQPHVFVSGLARAGTTVLMRRFHATGFYRSLTYRDMPFVLAPNLWRRLSLISKREIKNVERAHSDGLLVNADSPESFEEVFWRVFSGDEYLKKTHLVPHEPSEEVINEYIRYISAILSDGSHPAKRYLSKNNNNILRLGAIRQAFPKAVILIPFREPFKHALSLHRQHRHFSELQNMNKFTLSYMTWLGHHEFGLDHRPFLLGNGAVRSHQYPMDTLDYWLQLWCETYDWLENSKPEAAFFVSYEDLCAHEKNWSRIAELTKIPAGHMIGAPFKLSSRSVDASVDQRLADRASFIYMRLVKQARSQLS
jgi:hypothetical protein